MREPVVVTLQRAGDNYGYDQEGRALITFQIINGAPDPCIICGEAIRSGWSVSEHRRYIGHVCGKHVEVRRPA